MEHLSRIAQWVLSEHSANCSEELINIVIIIVVLLVWVRFCSWTKADFDEIVPSKGKADARRKLVYVSWNVPARGRAPATAFLE